MEYCHRRDIKSELVSINLFSLNWTWDSDEIERNHFYSIVQTSEDIDESSNKGNKL